jgi:hypothetical protein
VIYIHDFTHFRASQRCAVAVLDVVSRNWLSTVVSVEESSSQVEVASTDALVADGKGYLLEDEQLLEELAAGVIPDNDERLPVLLAISDNDPQMISKAAAVFLAGARIAEHFGRPSTPNDHAWIESFFGHLKGEFPHLEKIKDPGELEHELDRLRAHYNTVRTRAWATSPPTTSTTAAARPSEPRAEPGWPGHASAGLPPTASFERIIHDRPPVTGYYDPELVHLVRHTSGRALWTASEGRLASTLRCSVLCRWMDPRRGFADDTPPCPTPPPPEGPLPRRVASFPGPPRVRRRSGREPPSIACVLPGEDGADVAGFPLHDGTARGGVPAARLPVLRGAALARRGVPSTWRDIWTDEQARAFVRAANDGDETAPRVRVGDRTLTNPSAATVAALRGDRPRAVPRRRDAGPA